VAIYFYLSIAGLRVGMLRSAWYFENKGSTNCTAKICHYIKCHYKMLQKDLNLLNKIHFHVFLTTCLWVLQRWWEKQIFQIKTAVPYN